MIRHLLQCPPTLNNPQSLDKDCLLTRHKSAVFSLDNSAVNMTLPTFAAERRAAAPLLQCAGARSHWSICPATHCNGWQMMTQDRWTDARPWHIFCSAYYVGSVKNTSVNYLGDGVVVVNKLIRTTDNEDVFDSTGQVLATCVAYVEVQRPQNTWPIAAFTRYCTQTNNQQRTSYNCLHNSIILHHEAAKKNQFSFVCISFNTWQKPGEFFLFFFSLVLVPSVLWRCWLGGRKGIRPVKNWVVGC